MTKVIEMEVNGREELKEAFTKILEEVPNTIKEMEEAENETKRKMLERMAISINKETGYGLIPAKCECHLHIYSLKDISLKTTVEREDENISKILEIYGLEYNHNDYLEGKTIEKKYPNSLNGTEMAYLMANIWGTYEMMGNGLKITTILKDGSAFETMSLPGLFKGMRIGARGRVVDFAELFNGIIEEREIPEYLQDVILIKSLDDIVVE